MSDDKVIDFHTRDGLVSDGMDIDPDQILQEAFGKYFRVTIVGETEGGEIEVCGSDSAAETLMLLQRASSYLINNHGGGYE